MASKNKTPRLNDTAALISAPVYPYNREESRSVNVEKIENGYLTRESGCSDGRYYSKTTYSANAPSLGGEPAQDNSMKKAAAYLSKTHTTGK